MTTDLAIREPVTPATVRLSSEQLQYIAHTEFVPKAMRGKLPAILACVAMGRELGLGDLVALNTIHVIDGRTSLSAQAMVGLVRKRGHSIQGNFDGDSCTVTGRRADNGDEMSVTWTKEMASEAGLLGKDNWKKYTPSMLWNRAVSQLCRMLYADCFAGSAYTPDEIPETDFEFEPLGESVTEAADGADSPSGLASDAQKTKLNILVAHLVDGGHITKTQLWQAMGLDPQMGLGDDGEVHWSPLRDHLSREQASVLIERLSRLEAKVAAEVEA